jgi:hypothetical protein
MNRQKMIDVISDELLIRTDLNHITMTATDIADAIFAAMGDDDAEFHVRKDAPDTSKAMGVKVKRSGLQNDVLAMFVDLYLGAGIGATDDYVEIALGRSHQSVSGARNTLVKKGYLVDTGIRVNNRYGNKAIIWIYTGKAVER